jgi:ornithine cyclodeaminase/alanine dehydrogenase-like protein (mu-crystallin family)
MAGRLVVFDADAVRRGLSFQDAIPVVRQAMIALSDGRVRQNLRSFIGLGEGRTFAIMPAALDAEGAFGAKLISVFNIDGRKRHRGLVCLFDGETGAPVCLADAEQVTAIRTPAASAAATDALARPEASILAILGVGLQAAGHIEAIRLVRDLTEVRVWGRSPDKAQAFAAQMSARHGLPVKAHAEVRAAVEGADIVCTVTGAADPILEADWVSPGTHLNVVGSSGPGQAEISNALVARGRFIADHREHVLVHGGEFLRAKAAGLVGDDHVVAEIGEVFAGTRPGRQSPDEITIYKSLGHAAQDIAVTAWLRDHYEAA